SRDDRVEADISAVASDPDKQSGPRCIEAPFFVAPGKRGARMAVSRPYLRRRGRPLTEGYGIHTFESFSLERERGF
ncbi:MAG: hypothetical protein WCC03_19220, partial [Candidatus Acidiferrales bacterium]